MDQMVVKNRNIQQKMMVPNSFRTPFDVFNINQDQYFPNCKESENEAIIMLNTNILNSLYRKNTQLLPTTFETFGLQELVAKVTRALDNKYKFSKFGIHEVIQVGSFRNGTMQTGHNVADIVVLMTNLPSMMMIQEMSIGVHNLLNDFQSQKIVPKSEFLSMQITEKGFDVFNEYARVSIMVTTYPKNIMKIHDLRLRGHAQNCLAAVRHSKFLEENSNPFAKVLSRVMRYIVKKHPQLSMINPWMIDLLASFVIFNNFSNQPLSLNQAFLRIFQLLSAGIFTPNHGISDPCENFQCSINRNLSYDDQEIICETAQLILNKILAGGIDEILDLQD